MSENIGVPLPISALQRYSRQILLPEIGLEGQERLSRTAALVIGAGGLGCPALLALVGAGVGVVGVADGDSVEPTNLHRQFLFGPQDTGRSKANVAQERLSALNPSVFVRAYPAITEADGLLLAKYDVILDATDSPASRTTVASAVLAANRPLVWGAASGWDGQVMTLAAGSAFPAEFDAGQTVGAGCDELGVLGATTSVIGSIMALEAIKLLAGLTVEFNVLTHFDALSGRFRRLAL